MNEINNEKTETVGINSKTNNFKKTKGPESYGWFALGQGRGIKWTLWPNSVVFQRREKQGDNWLTTEEIHVAPKILKEIVWRIPGWLEVIDRNNGRGKK